MLLKYKIAALTARRAERWFIMIYNINGKATEMRIAIEINEKDTNLLDRTIYCDPANVDRELKLINTDIWTITRIYLTDNLGREYKGV
jgi:hypothetical protein